MAIPVGKQPDNGSRTPPKHVLPPTPHGVLLESEIKQVRKVVHDERRALGRIPLLLPLVGSFGIVSVFYGFEGILASTPLADQPVLLVGIGVVLLLFTGAAANKL